MFKPGDVVWGHAPDYNGIWKHRPLLVITPPAVNKEQSICCLCISTDAKIDPEDPVIELPFAPNGGSTGLKRWCAVVLRWHHLIDQASVKKSGVIPRVLLDRVLQERQAALQRFGAKRR